MTRDMITAIVLVGFFGWIAPRLGFFLMLVIALIWAMR